MAERYPVTVPSVRDNRPAAEKEEQTIGGGAFYVMGGTLNIHGGSIIGNASYRGGAITFHYGPYARGTVNITGGTITGNYCTSGDGGAIYMPTAAKSTSGTTNDQIFDQTVNTRRLCRSSDHRAW